MCGRLRDAWRYYKRCQPVSGLLHPSSKGLGNSKSLNGLTGWLGSQNWPSSTAQLGPDPPGHSCRGSMTKIQGGQQEKQQQAQLLLWRPTVWPRGAPSPGELASGKEQGAHCKTSSPGRKDLDRHPGQRAATSKQHQDKESRVNKSPHSLTKHEITKRWKM